MSDQRGSLRSYLDAIRGYPLLSESGEFRVASAARAGEPLAHDHLVQANLRLVVKIARECGRNGASFEDLISEGNLGLIEAARRFDPGRGVRFVCYAAWWIRKYVLLALQRQGAQASVPIPGPPSSSRGAPRQRARLLSLEECSGRTGSRDALDVIADPAGTRPDHQVMEQDLRGALRAALRRLPPRERAILEAHHGLGHRPPRSLQSIGDELGFTRERVRQIERHALDRARRLMAASPGHPRR
jgi:RNA polymerase sigma factor (sigma-70 family)